MPVIAAHTVSIADGNQAVYNGLDCTLTHEIDEALRKLQRNDTLIYDFERGMQGPCLEMMLRGFRVDIDERERAIISTKARRDSVGKVLETLIRAITNGYNAKLPNSPTQLKSLFYETMKLSPIEKFMDGEMKRPMNRETLEKLEITDKWAAPIVNSVLLHRDLSKALQTLETCIDADWRWRCSYNIGGTSTGRWSSSKSPFINQYEDSAGGQSWRQSGGNFQNVTEELRRVFIPDPGFKLYGIDKAQSEARDVGFLCGLVFGDWSYLDACECLTADHEVLTPTGWVSIADMPDEIMEWRENGTLKFEKVIRWNTNQTNSLINFSNRNIEITGTLNHDMPIYCGKYSNRIEKRSLSDIRNSRNYKAPLVGKLVDDTGKPEPLAAIFAAFQADGTIDRQDRVHWTFSKPRKIVAMQSLLDNLQLKYSKYELGNGTTRFYLHAGQGQTIWPKVGGAYILTWNSKSIQEFCESHCMWDAGVTEDNYSIVNESKSHIEWLATAFMLNGQATTIHKHKGIYWELTIKNNVNTQYRSCSITDINNENSIFTVYCPTTKSGYFMVRRNGKMFPSGNSGDLHTNVTKLLYPEWNWTENPKLDRQIAERRFYRLFTYRDASKRLGHATNYFGRPKEISRQTRIPLNLVEEFQRRYFAAFPCIQKMHQWVAAQLQTTRFLVNSFGRRRDFFDNPNVEDTLKSAIAYLFQSATGDCLNLGLWRLWKNMGTRIQILSQLHDAVYFQAPIPVSNEAEQAMLREALHWIQIEQTDPRSGRKMTIPGEIVGGFNWAHRFRLLADGSREEWNPNGLDGIRIAA